jgi:hypothetical protein
MTTRLVIICDRPTCTRQISSNFATDPAEFARTQGWTSGPGRHGWVEYTCDECASGRTLEETLLIHGGILMLEAFRRFDGGADCYPVPCRSEGHDNDGCLIHVYGDDDGDMEGPYVQIIGSGCGSYHAQIVDHEGNVIVESGSEIWYEL